MLVSQNGNVQTEEKKEERKERMMSRCFTWFPIGGYRRTKYISQVGWFYKNGGILLGGCL